MATGYPKGSIARVWHGIRIEFIVYCPPLSIQNANSGFVI